MRLLLWRGGVRSGLRVEESVKRCGASKGRWLAVWWTGCENMLGCGSDFGRIKGDMECGIDSRRCGGRSLGVGPGINTCVEMQKQVLQEDTKRWHVNESQEWHGCVWLWRAFHNNWYWAFHLSDLRTEVPASWVLKSIRYMSIVFSFTACARSLLIAIYFFPLCTEFFFQCAEFFSPKCTGNFFQCVASRFFFQCSKS